jgi:plasmid stabilization system protein ParE
MKIIWSTKAKYTFYNTQRYLEQNWNSEVAKKFVTEIVHTINSISKDPHLGKYKINLQCHEIMVSKHTSLYYETKSDYIFIFTLRDHRQKSIQFSNL